jgi:hypothetical protein
MTDAFVLIPLLMLASALVGMASNRLPSHWGLLALPAYLIAWILGIFAYGLLVAPDQGVPLTLQGVINDALFMLFPLLLLTGPPFLVGRYVPQVASFVRRRGRSHADISRHV